MQMFVFWELVSEWPKYTIANLRRACYEAAVISDLLLISGFLTAGVLLGSISLTEFVICLPVSKTSYLLSESHTIV